MRMNQQLHLRTLASAVVKSHPALVACTCTMQSLVALPCSLLLLLYSY